MTAKKAVPDERSLQEAALLVERARAGIAALDDQRSMLAQAVHELSLSKAALQAFRDAKAGEELLIPLGAGHFARASLTAPDRIVMGIGSGVSVESGLQEALARIEDQLRLAQANDGKLRHQQEELIREYEAVASSLQPEGE